MRTLAPVLVSLLILVPFVAHGDDPPPTPPPPPSRPQMNPDLSVTGLFSLSQFSTDSPLTFEGGHDPKQNGFNLQQLELTLGAAIDPYFRGDSNIVLVPEDGEMKVEIEEAYATTLDLPLNLQIKAGTFFTAFGRQNPQHPHAWEFVDKPLVLGRMFGGDGLRGLGAQLSWLSPLPWYSEFLYSGQNSTGETATSFRPEGSMRALDDALNTVRWNNFFSVTEELSLNLGGSLASGPNAADDERRMTRIFGADLFLRYRRGNSLSFIALQAEAVKRISGSPDGALQDWGWYAELYYRLNEPFQRWHIGLRYDWVSAKQPGAVNTSPGEVDALTGIASDRDMAKRSRIAPAITFYPSEFSKLRLQYDRDRVIGADQPQHLVSLQLEFLMGAHGAHKF